MIKKSEGVKHDRYMCRAVMDTAHRKKQTNRHTSYLINGSTKLQLFYARQSVFPNDQ